MFVCVYINITFKSNSNFLSTKKDLKNFKIISWFSFHNTSFSTQTYIQYTTTKKYGTIEYEKGYKKSSIFFGIPTQHKTDFNYELFTEELYNWKSNRNQERATFSIHKCNTITITTFNSRNEIVRCYVIVTESKLFNFFLCVSKKEGKKI